ncbi:MAG: hypothetical protein ABI889_14440 [Gemmatimonadota bacterium]
MSRSSRRSFTFLITLVALSAPATSRAQFGKLLKRKAAEKAIEKVAPTGDPAVPAAVAATPGDADRKAREDAWQHPVAISSSTLDAYLKGIKAENAARATYVASAPPTSAMGRWNAYQAEKAKCVSDKVKDDSAQARLQRKMMTEATAGHAENIQKYTDSMTAIGTASQERDRRCNGLARPDLTDDDYKAVHAEDDKEEATGAAAAGLSPFVYARLKERVIAYTLLPKSWKPSGYSPEELQAIDARRVEIKSAMGSGFNTSGQRNPVGS